MRNLHLSGNSPFFLASFLKSFAELTFVTGLPFYAIHLGAGPMELGIVGAAGMGVYTLSCLAISRWVDRLPPKMLAVASLVLASFNAVSVFMVDSVYSLVLVAGINGFLSGGYWPPVMTWISRRSADTDLTRQLGYFNLSWSIGGPIGTVVTGFLFEVSPALPFFVAASALLCASFVMAGVRGERPTQHTGEESHHESHGSIQGRRSGKRYFLYLSWISMLATFFLMGNIRYQLPKRAIAGGMTESEVAIFLFLMSVAQLILFVVLLRSDRWQFRFRYIFLAHVVSILSMFVLFWSISPMALLLSMLLYGAGNSVTYFSSLYYGMVFRTVRGRNTAIHESTIGGGFLCGAFVGGLVAERWGLSAPYPLCAGITLVATSLWAIAARRESRAV